VPARRAHPAKEEREIPRAIASILAVSGRLSTRPTTKITAAVDVGLRRRRSVGLTTLTSWLRADTSLDQEDFAGVSGSTSNASWRGLMPL
jgi:hypothetical protein